MAVVVGGLELTIFLFDYRRFVDLIKIDKELFKIYEIQILISTVIILTIIFIPLVYLLRKHHYYEFKVFGLSIFFFYGFEILSAITNFASFFLSGATNSE